MSEDIKKLRSLLRGKRRALRSAQQRAAARRLLRAVSRSAEFHSSKRIALYVAADGEINPYALCRRAWQLNKQVYLPVLHPLQHNRLLFVRYCARDVLRRNRFGIAEPLLRRRATAPWHLDMVLTPLVAFDADGNRLGMGGGFYDRTFSRRQTARWPRRPRLYGLAHAFQQVAALPVNAWDIPLARIFTD